MGAEPQPAPPAGVARRQKRWSYQGVAGAPQQHAQVLAAGGGATVLARGHGRRRHGWAEAVAGGSGTERPPPGTGKAVMG
jgi:hypothetical protein